MRLEINWKVQEMWKGVGIYVNIHKGIALSKTLFSTPPQMVR